MVPVIEKKKNVGEIDLDAHNGSNLGVMEESILNKIFNYPSGIILQTYFF